MKHFLIFFIGIFSASTIQGAVVPNQYADSHKAIGDITNTYLNISRGILENSAILSDYHNTTINLAAQQILSDAKTLINQLKNEWERDGKKNILEMVEGIDMSACSNIFNVYDEYANELLNDTINCTSAYSHNISQTIHAFNNTVDRITEDAFYEINIIKARAEACLKTYAGEEGSNVYACTQSRLGELPNVSRNPEYVKAEMNVVKIARLIKTNIYSCKLNQQDKKKLQSKLTFYNNDFSRCVVEKEKEAHSAFRIKFDRNNIESTTTETTTPEAPIEVSHSKTVDVSEATTDLQSPKIPVE